MPSLVSKAACGECVLVLLFAIGCSPAPSDDYDVVIDPAFSEGEATYVKDALHEWVTTLDGRLRFPSVTTGPCAGTDHEICVHAASAADIASLGGTPSTLGRTERYDSSDRADVYVLAYADPTTSVTQTIAHELGHAMGLEHTQAGTLMCYDSSCAARAPTCDDVAQWESVRSGPSVEAGCPHGGTFTFSGR